MNGRFFLLVWLFCFLGIAAPAFAQPEPAEESAVAAIVGDDPIQVAEAQRMLDGLFRDKKQPSGDLLPMAQAQVLEVIVDRRLVLTYARRLGELPSAEELAKAKKQLQIRLAAQGRKAPGAPKGQSLSPAEMEQQVLWRLVWDRYLAKYCTPQRREAWFRDHHADLDGTELVVSHILLRPAAGAGAEEFDALEKQAESIRAEIASGKIDFASAARKYSAGPSRKQDGRLGKIGRKGPMDESFTRAAFKLKAGEISPPVRSPFGVHLIRCDEVLPGTKTVADLAEPIDEALGKELLEKLAKIERQQTPVKYTSAWPHFKPGTRELAK
jgi:parvulin-like peptidyl-prolyl isomerase